MAGESSAYGCRSVSSLITSPAGAALVEEPVISNHTRAPSNQNDIFEKESIDTVRSKKI